MDFRQVPGGGYEPKEKEMAIAISFFSFSRNPGWERSWSHCDRMSFFLTKFVSTSELYFSSPNLGALNSDISIIVNDLEHAKNLGNADYIGQSDAA
jgi:hypothetical protein